MKERMALCSEVMPNDRQEQHFTSPYLTGSHCPVLQRSSGSLTPLPSTAAASPHTDEDEAEAAAAGQRRSPACPLHGVFLSEEYVKSEGSDIFQSTREQPGGGGDLNKRTTGSSGSDQSSSNVRNSSRFESSSCARRTSTGATEAGLRKNGSSTEVSSVSGTTRESSGGSSSGDSGGKKSGCCGRSSADGRGRPLVIFRNCVYCLTDFHHPGGDELLEGRYGTDITEAFEEAGHSTAAYKLLDSYLVGIVAERRQAYIEQVGGAVCLCPGSSTGSKGKSFPSATPADRGCEQFGVSSTENQQATKFSAVKGFHALQAAPPKPIPTGTDGFPVHPLIDFHRPLLPQIWDLNKENYIQLISCYSLTTNVMPLMPYAWVEPFTKAPWWVVPLVWAPWTLFLLHLSCRTNSAAAVVWMILLGIGVWTVLEYFMHRFLFHIPEDWIPDSSVVRLAHFLLHAVHHVLPLDPLRLVMPPMLLIVLSVAVYAALSLIFPQWLIWGSWPGGMLGYMAYDLVHYSTHHSSFLSRLAHVRKMKAYHMQHHFKRPTLGFGVSNKIWDHVFGTTLPP